MISRARGIKQQIAALQEFDAPPLLRVTDEGSVRQEIAFRSVFPHELFTPTMVVELQGVVRTATLMLLREELERELVETRKQLNEAIGELEELEKGGF